MTDSQTLRHTHNFVATKQPPRQILAVVVFSGCVCSSEFSATIILALNYTNACQNTQQVLQSFLDFFFLSLYPQ
jgi:hypothetical protein